MTGSDASLLCVPVIGHLAAFIQRNASDKKMEITKNSILQCIQNGMTSGRYASDNTPRVVYVSEHGIFSQTFQTHNSESESRRTIWVPIIAELLGAFFGVIAILLIIKHMISYQIKVMDGKKTGMPLGNTPCTSFADNEPGEVIFNEAADEFGSYNIRIHNDNHLSHSYNASHIDDVHSIHSDNVKFHAMSFSSTNNNHNAANNGFVNNSYIVNEPSCTASALVNRNDDDIANYTKADPSSHE